MKWALIADSSCNLRGYRPKASDAMYAFAPLKINVAGTEFVDDDELDVPAFNKIVAEEESASSSACPSAGEWAELFRSADNVIAITISANLSGSYEAAVIAKDIVDQEGGHNIHVINSRAAGGKLELLIEMLDEYIAQNDPDFEDACAYIDDVERRSTVLFSLCSYENLTKSGRMPKMAGVLANRLNIRILGCASDEGTIKVMAPARSQKKMFGKIVDAMGHHGFDGGIVYIDHVDNEKASQELADVIRRQWPDVQVRIVPCGGLCSYYAEESGMIIGYAWA